MKLKPKPTASDKRDFEEFQRLARHWLQCFGLTDWNVAFDHEEQTDDRMASIRMNSAVRRATITLRFGQKRASSLEYLAAHEVAHLLLADLTDVCGRRGENHDDSIREEHRLIERLVPVLLEGLDD